jgi:hypothetical protein
MNLPQEIRCSSLSRTMNCIGFLSVENILQSEEGQPARDGTACGELLTAMIKQKNASPIIGKVAQNGTPFDADMWFYARDTYFSILEKAQDAEVTSEERIDWMTTSGIKIRGSYDVSFYRDRTLYIDDLKYGWVIVDEEENWQLLGYAIGRFFQLNAQGIPVDQIQMTIHQPRPYSEKGKVRPWTITISELQEYYNKIEKKMMALVQGDKTISTNKNCKYCEAAATCPALNRSFNKAIDTVMKDWTDKPLTNEEISETLDLILRAEELFKIKASAMKDLAINRIQNGQPIKGYAYQQKFGDRKWRDGVSAASIKIMTGVDIVKSEMMSPAQAEKAGLHKKFVAGLTMTPSKGLDLVKSDNSQKAASVFTRPEGI